ncbi:MAG: helix-turn-helix domain-containing protein [Ktedonobacteraceae bacterium]|nr:helix-turn-helix domain-containing protein [Ktedonobacteraceae bacterium]
MSDDKKLPVTYTVAEVSKILHRTPQTIRRLIKENKLPAVRVGGGYLITEETLQKLLSGEIKAED